ncbi:MAG: AarF/ABC1/UbiB kinase family protein [Myxococcales bacterium]|nr:AarF/ABC1/UbiB kinase family protein [Myxococcales bacterium]
MKDERSLPTGRFGRLGRLVSVGARAGLDLLSSRDSQRSAERAAEVLGTLRGLAAKVGQMASYVDGVIPEQHRTAYETAMGALRSAAPRSPYPEIKQLIETELGASLDELFDSFEEHPVASASIGQVHRAIVKTASSDGSQEVAVKVQHPGIVTALESDLANASILEQMMAIGGTRRFNSQGMLEMIRTRFREELDYRLEAERQRAFARIHASDPTIRVPRVLDELSTGRVLTSEFVRGASFEQAIAASDAERRAWAETMWRFVFKGNLGGGMFNADPHPGNYLFSGGGVVTFLDYGCVQPIPPEQHQWAFAVHRAAIARDEHAFREAGKQLLSTRPGPLEELVLRYLRRCFEPLFVAPFRMTRDYARSLVEDFKEMSTAALKMDAAHAFAMPTEILFMNRLQFGFYSVLARLDVAVDYAAIETAFLK